MLDTEFLFCVLYDLSRFYDMGDPVQLCEVIHFTCPRPRLGLQDLDLHLAQVCVDFVLCVPNHVIVIRPKIDVMLLVLGVKHFGLLNTGHRVALLRWLASL